MSICIWKCERLWCCDHVCRRSKLCGGGENACPTLATCAACTRRVRGISACNDVISLELEACSSVSTLGTKETSDGTANARPLAKEAEMSFRAAAARSNYLSIDRPDCQFASKEMCRLMTTPKRMVHAALERLRRYLAGLDSTTFLGRVDHFLRQARRQFLG